MAIVSAFCIQELSLAGSEMRVLMDLSHHQQERLAADKLMRQISNTFSLSCTMAPVSAAEIVQKPLPWWIQYGCGGGNKRSYYVVEPLMADNCAILSNNQSVVAHYFRITLMSEKFIRVILQANVIRVTPRVNKCSEGERLVELGVQWVREL